MSDAPTGELFPLRISHVQWPEARSFERLYGHNPDAQARLIKTLLGLRALMGNTADATEQRTVEAVDIIIDTFTNRFPDYLTEHEEGSLDYFEFHDAYIPEDRMLWLLEERD